MFTDGLYNLPAFLLVPELRLGMPPLRQARFRIGLFSWRAVHPDAVRPKRSFGTEGFLKPSLETRENLPMHVTNSKIAINAPPQRVWDVLTRPELVERWQRGSELVTT